MSVRITKPSQGWLPLPIPEDPRSLLFKSVVRLNSLGSLYFFEKFTLKRDRLSDGFHKPILTRLENDYLRYLLECPRDHLKTTMVTEGRNIWRVLPFNEADEAQMRMLGYGDSWIEWMRWIHNPARRILIVSETIQNAVKLGHNIDWHYEENDLFRHVFPEIIPTAKETWNDESKQQRAATRGAHGEGTFDYLGVGGALQSRHYTDVDEDDVVGKDALESEAVMEKTINYHRLLIGAFERFKTGTWMVVNNRWAPNDLSAFIRGEGIYTHERSASQKGWVIESHRALGGCPSDGCPERHPEGTPVFPEEFDLATFAEIRETQGPYFFSHQFLNLPVNPEDAIFKPEWLRYYSPLPDKTRPGRHLLHHEVKDTEVIADINPNHLVRSMIVDPNHAGANGRARHALAVTGFDPETDRLYLLDVWAASASYDALMEEIYKHAELWNLPAFWLETVAAQKYLKYHIEYRNKVEKRSLVVNALKSDTGANAKRVRIEALEPLFKSGRIWVRRDQTPFLDEYFSYPSGLTVDVLDALSYAPQTWNTIHAKRINDILSKRRDAYRNRRVGHTGY